MVSNRLHWFDSKPDGTILGQKVTALQRVGVYVPGGKAAYPSSVLMNIMPAKVAVPFLWQASVWRSVAYASQHPASAVFSVSPPLFSSFPQ